MMLALFLALTGFYTANQGEVAAAIELSDDGKFAYSLDYGAVSEIAEGTWVDEGGKIYLTTIKSTAPYRQAAFTREPLTLDGERLVLHRYDIDIRFNRDDSLPTPPNRNTKL